MQFNPALKNLPVYQPGRPIEEVARELNLKASDIIKLASNENPVGPSKLAQAAIEKAIASMHIYPDGNAFYLKQKLASHLGVESGHLILGNGSNELIEFVAHALLGPGDQIVVSEYCFAIYPIVARMFGADVITVPAKSYGHDLKSMVAAITDRTKIIFVANPNNPTGTTASAQEILELVERVPSHVLLVMDEAYIEFLEDAADLIPHIRDHKRANLLLMRTFSKIYGLAGLRVGYGIGSQDLIGTLEKIRQPFNINSMAQAGAMAALDDASHLDKTRTLNREGLEQLVQGLSKQELEIIPSQANFLMVRVGAGQQVFEALQKLGVIVRPMGGYQLPEWIRVTVGTKIQNDKFLDALAQVRKTT